MLKAKQVIAVLLCGLMCLSAAPIGASQLNSNTATVALSLAVGESISVTATPAAISWPSVPGTTQAPSSNITTVVTWTVAASRVGHTLSFFYYFSSPNALTGGGNTIPASAFSGAFNGTSTGACNQADPTGGSNGCDNGVSMAFTSANLAGSRTDQFTLTFNEPATLFVANYVGTLNIVIQAS